MAYAFEFAESTGDPTGEFLIVDIAFIQEKKFASLELARRKGKMTLDEHATFTNIN